MFVTVGVGSAYHVHVVVVKSSLVPTPPFLLTKWLQKSGLVLLGRFSSQIALANQIVTCVACVLYNCAQTSRGRVVNVLFLVKGSTRFGSSSVGISHSISILSFWSPKTSEICV